MFLLLTVLAACSDVEDVGAHTHDHNHGVVDVVELSLVPRSGGDAIVAEYHGGEADALALVSGETYDLSLTLLASDGDDLTIDVLDDAESHQVFYLGDGVDSDATGTADGVLSIDYADADSGGLPIGLEATAVASGDGAAALRVVLRHLPPENDVALKVEGLAETVAAEGLAAIGGDSDVDVTFDVTVAE